MWKVNRNAPIVVQLSHAGLSGKLGLELSADEQKKHEVRAQAGQSEIDRCDYCLASERAKFRLSWVVDHALEQEVELMWRDDVTVGRKLFWNQQLTCLKVLLKVGLPTHVDIGVFGLFGLQLLRKHSFSGLSFGADGSLAKWW